MGHSNHNTTVFILTTQIDVAYENLLGIIKRKIYANYLRRKINKSINIQKSLFTYHRSLNFKTAKQMGQ